MSQKPVGGLEKEVKRNKLHKPKSFNMRHRFEEIFHEENGQLTPLHRIRVGGVIFGPGVKFGQGVAFGGVDFYQFRGKDIEADEQDGVLVIKGIY